MAYTARKWVRLDNAAKIYPAAKNRSWNALFRISANLFEPVDPEILKQAQTLTLRRFPTMAMKLRHGAFWYYLEQTDEEPELEEDVANPCVRMDFKKSRGGCIRVRYYGTRIAVEFFHVLTDGTGGLIFTKTLVAEYLKMKYGADIPRGADIFDCTEEPRDEEVEDSFLKCGGKVAMSRSEPSSFRIRGEREADDFIHITTGIVNAAEIIAKAKEKNVTVTEYLTAVMIMGITAIQKREKLGRHLSQVKICVPVNLRAYFPSHTVRNFANYVNPGIDPRYGDFTFDEVLSLVKHQIGIDATEKRLRAKITKNIQIEKNPVLRATPLFVKNGVMKLVFNITGDRKTSICISNLGRVKLPDEMEKYVERMEFILGPLSLNPVACAILSYNGIMYINFTRTITDPKVECEFFRRLVRLGIHVKLESNQRYD